ncbi:MAG: sugar phosphate isomerase/epimerase [Butyrivibrio sp.]|nr:sugar phosphate isomerase/epimerase [Butyrivibrio sp.]
MEIGAQLYTVRDFCKTEEGLLEALRKIADIGYENIQVSGTCDYTAEWLAAALKETGLKCVLTHIEPERIAQDTEAVMREHNVFGCGNIGIGYYEVHKDGVEAFYRKFARAAKALSEGGKRLCYHNHDHEFIKIDGETVLKRLADRFAPEQLCFTLDTYWVQAGGADSAQWIDFLKGRVPCVHLKDMEYGRKMAPLGKGNINLDGVIAACDRAGTEYLLVEQDDCYGQDPFDCLKISYDFLRSRGF